MQTLAYTALYLYVAYASRGKNSAQNAPECNILIEKVLKNSREGLSNPSQIPPPSTFHSKPWPRHCMNRVFTSNCCVIWFDYKLTIRTIMQARMHFALGFNWYW